MPKKLDPTDRTPTPSGRQQVNFRIDPALLKRIDSTADSFGISRSELFLKAAEMVCDRPDILTSASPSPALDPTLDKRLDAIEESIPSASELETLIEKRIQQALDATLDRRLDGMEDRILGKSVA